jgi:leucyl aminopeptidase
MQIVHRVPAMAGSTRPLEHLDADLLALPVFQDDDLADVPGLAAAADGEIARARSRSDLTGELYEVFAVPLGGTGFAASRAILVGAGKRADFTLERLRRVATVAGLSARQRRATRLAFACRGGAELLDVPARLAQVVAEGIVLANYDGRAYKTTDTKPRLFLDQVEIQVAGQEVADAVARGALLGEWTNQARALANAPGNELTPRAVAERALALAEPTGLAVEVLDEAEIARLRMGLLLGVGQGSAEPPRVVVLRHDPPDAPPGVVLGLVGKGITFDSGGISIKPAENMHRMKDDMSGGAAVVCAMAAIARLGVKVRCVGVVPLAENMPGGRAMKPGDVLTGASGKTVEILNTDAEGRLALGDAVWYARERGATHIVDVATLTGACVVALGKTTSGLFGTPESWVGHVRRAGERAGERLWPMPVYEDYAELLKSDIADMSNTGGRPGGAITGALFVKAFAGELPWAHLDIAGTAWADEATPYQPAGATGVGMRTLVELALDVHNWS